MKILQGGIDISTNRHDAPPAECRVFELLPVKPTERLLERYYYDKITEILFVLFDDDFRYRCDEFRERVKEYRNKNRKEFHSILERVFNENKYEEVRTYRTWREIAFTANRYRECEVCGRVFYDLSRNGRTTVCHYGIKMRYDDGTWKSVCEAEKENAASRRHYNRVNYGVDYDGYQRLSGSTRERLEREMFLPYDPYDKNERIQRMARWIEANIAGYDGDFRDPQDIVCGTPTTHTIQKAFRTPWRIRLKEDVKTETIFTISVKTGEKLIHNKEKYEKFFDFSQ